ncbi:hypothetical protein QQF64_016687 [Cirrhinus molitorella]|uniref:C2H2-type domain-containing protein n=1 Tax=Cirrhinus molitorella TaxID=172907 RepID=A0ABR3LNJ8_9TELE
MASQKIIGDCSDSDACLQDSLLKEGGLDLHSGQSSVYSSKTSEGQWMEEIQESEEEQGASVTTQSEDINANVKVWQNGKKTSDIVPFGRVSDCPPRTDSSLRHCASESRTEENWPHHIDDIKDCDFVDSDTGKCVPDSSLSSPGQYQQKPDVPALPEVVVELEDFDDPGECFPNPPHDLPVCPDCSQCFATVRDLYAHNCAKEFPEAKMKKSHQCDICFKFFNAPSKLKRHWVTHTGQRPFKCTRCQKSFTQPHHLKTHMQSHR